MLPPVLAATDDVPIVLLEKGEATGATGLLHLPPAPPADAPLVSCLMVSRGRVEPARHAIAGYRRQSYRQRELVIVAVSPEPALIAHVASLGDRSIRLHRTGPASLGELRNASVGLAAGDLLMTWDDDDLHAPQRIELMAAALMAADAGAAFLRRILHWWPREERLIVASQHVWECSMLARRAALPPFPAMDRGEDIAAIRALRRRHRIVLVDRPAGYVRFVHGANTCPDDYFERVLARADQRWDGAAGRDVMRQLGWPVRAGRESMVNGTS